jgi:predicted transcriptional regulator
MNKSIIEAKRIVSASVREEDAARLERLAQEADRSLSAEIRRAVRAHLERAASEEGQRWR